MIIHQHDKKWIKEQLEQLPHDKRFYVLDRYKLTFNQTLKESSEHEARRKANLELLNLVKQYK